MADRWDIDALCRGEDTDLWFPEAGAPDNQGKAAKTVCARCEVAAVCLDEAVEARIPDGIFGGSGGARRQWLSAVRAAVPAAVWDRIVERELAEVRRWTGVDPRPAPIEPQRDCWRCGSTVPQGRHPVDWNGPDATCGKVSTYNRGCRCLACKAEKQDHGRRGRSKSDPPGGSVGDELTTTHERLFDMGTVTEIAPVSDDGNDDIDGDLADSADCPGCGDAWQTETADGPTCEYCGGDGPAESADEGEESAETLTDEELAAVHRAWESTEPVDPSGEIFEHRRLNLEGLKPDAETVARIGVYAQRVNSSDRFWLGDWGNWAEKHYGDRFWQFVDQALVQDPKTLSNYMGVCARIPLAERADGVRPTLSWSHYRYAADLPETGDRLAVLDRAEAEGLTTNQTQDICRAMKKGQTLDDATEEAVARDLATTGSWSLTFTLGREHLDWGNTIHEALQKALVKHLGSAGIEATKITPTKSGAATSS